MPTSSELPLWQLVTARFHLGTHSNHGPRHWRTVLRNGLYLCRHHEADEEVVRFFALFHDSCRENEFHDPEHGCRGAKLEQTLERFRRDLLQRSAEDYRNQPGAMANLTDGLNRLRENAVQLARSDAREIISRFGQMGTRRLAAVS